jgi:hypothetical protein
MTLEICVAIAGMAIGTGLILKGQRRDRPKEFVFIGGFLLVTGFCYLLHLKTPGFIGEPGRDASTSTDRK